jgi:hypothetical protein
MHCRRRLALYHRAFVPQPLAQRRILMSSTPQDSFPSNNLTEYRGCSPKILFHCHVFPADPVKFPPDPATGFSPGSVEHLRALARQLGFDRVTAISPSEVPPGRATARIDERKDGLAWLAEKAKLGADVMLFATLNPEDKRLLWRPQRPANAASHSHRGHPPLPAVAD